MVLAILMDGGFGRQCQVTVGNREIYLEDVEALEFLWKKDDKSTEEVDGQDDDRDERVRTKSLLALNSFFAEPSRIRMGHTSQKCRWEEDEEEDDGLLLGCTPF